MYSQENAKQSTTFACNLQCVWDYSNIQTPIERPKLETNNLKNDFSSDFQSESRIINPINLHIVVSGIREHPPI